MRKIRADHREASAQDQRDEEQERDAEDEREREEAIANEPLDAAHSELVSITSPGRRIKYTIDALGSQIREEHKNGSDSYVLERRYDLSGQVIATTSSLGFDVALERGPSGDPLKTILSARRNPKTITHELDREGREVGRLLPRGGTIRSTFDTLGNLLERSSARNGARAPERRIGEPAYLGEQTGHLSFFRKYMWNELESLTSVSGSGGVGIGYEYNSGINVTAIQRPNRRREFQYDEEQFRFEVGEQTRIGAGGRILEKGNTRYKWDSDGQLIEKRILVDDGELVHRYFWTAKGQLARVELPDDARVEFGYDALWRRIEKRVYRRDLVTFRPTLVSSTRFFWDGDALAEEISERYEGGAMVESNHRRYCFDDESLLPLAHQDAIGDDGEWFHYVNDQVGMPETLLDDQGDVAATLERDEFGAARMADGARTETPIRFVGQYADVETGLSYNRFRYYDPDANVFVSPDPAGIDGDMNPYSYVPDPLTWMDPLGLKPSKSMRLGDALEKQRVDDLSKKKPGKTTNLPDMKVGAGNGIEILAVTRKKGKNGKPGAVTAIRIEECKTGKSKLGKTKSGKQMSKRWLKKKLKGAMAKKSCSTQDKADIQAALDAVEGNPPNAGKLQMAVVHQPVSGKGDKRRRSGKVTSKKVDLVGETKVKLGPKKPVP